MYKPRTNACARWWSCFVAIALVVLLSHSNPLLHAQAQPPLRVAAAADLQPLLPALLTSYERQTGQHAEASFASSATLATQIENGAPFDVFMAANMAFPQKVAQDGFAAVGSSVAPYARGTLVLWTRNQRGVAQ